MKLTILSILFPLFVTSSYSFSIPWKFMKSSAIKLIKDQTLDEDCAADLQNLILDSSNFKLWALKMLDASSKLNSGILTGNFVSIGDYDECVSVKETVQGRDIIGQYCTVFWGIVDHPFRAVANYSIPKNFLENTRRIDPGQIWLKLSTNLTLLINIGICVPKSCSVENLDKLLHAVEKKFNLPTHFPMLEVLCAYKDKPIEYTNLDICIYCFFIIVFLIILVCTIYDIYLRYSGKESDILVSFSAYSNAKRLFSYRSTTPNALDCLDGMKVISAFWVVVGHGGGGILATSKNLLYLWTEWKENLWNTPVWSAFYAVDSFFTIGGLLLTYTYLRLTKNSSIGLFTFYWARYLRLTPGLLATAFIHTIGPKLLADGPFAQLINHSFTKVCRDSWWTALFHFINWKESEMCIQHGWYVANDTQLYLWAPLALFFMRKHPKKVMTGLGFAFLAGVVYSLVITVKENIGYIPFMYNMDYERILYQATMYHLPSWVIGVVFGYLLHEKEIKISRFWNIFLWIISVYTMVKLNTNQLIFFNEPFNIHRAVLWNTLARPTWSLALCFMITSCATGRGGFINDFLSHPIFKILRKLTFGVYLLHVGILGTEFMNIRETHYFTNFHMITKLCVSFAITLMHAIPFYLAFEAPLDALRFYQRKSVEKEAKPKSN